MGVTSRLPTLLGRWRAVLLAAGARHRVRLPYVAAAHALGVLAGLVPSGPARAVELPEDRADLMYHYYDGAGTKAYGPALLVRKSIADKFSLAGGYYIDQVSNASIDVVTTASKYKETRREETLSADYVYRDAAMTFAVSNSREPDYRARSAGLDVTQETFGGMTTVALGYTRAWDDVGQKNVGFFDRARHWRYRFGLTQVLTPRLLTSLNFEAVSDDGFLGSPYRVARVFGAAVPERVPRTRTSRSLQWRLIGDLGSRDSLRLEYRYSWDTWAIRANTLETGYSRYFGGDKWLADAYLRYYTQQHAIFYADNALADTTYVSRNRTYSTFKSYGLGTRVAYSAKRVPGKYEIKLNGALERSRFNFKDFTDIRDGSQYKYDATIVQLFVSATY